MQHRRPRSRFRLTRLSGLWRRGAPAPPAHPSGDAPATLIAADPGAAPLRRGDAVAEMIAAHASGLEREATTRPRANPAFAEALFVELMRAHQFRRAYDLLSSDSRRAWGSPQAFAAAQARGSGSMSRLRGVRVVAVRHLPEWTDAERGVTHHEVAELDADYVVGPDDAVVTRVVHLVADSGKWRSLCYPSGTDR